MFLDWIAQLRLLQHDSQTNILGSLPLSIRRALISEITQYLHPASGKLPPDPSIFSSPAHVKWFMEVVGQGFNLPLEDMAITNSDIDIYSRWLFEQDTRPEAVVKEGLDQEFYQIIFHQFSLLFQPRIARNTSGALQPSINVGPQQPPLPPPPPAAALVGIQQHKDQRPQNVLNNRASSGGTIATHTNIAPLSSFVGLPSNIPNNNSSASNNSNSNNNSNLNNLINTTNAQTSALKETLSQLVIRHVELCKKTLKVIAIAGRTLKLTAETWSVLLKVMLGITDYLLKEPMGENVSLGVMSMADELCDLLLQVLFELWLRSNIMDVEMWDILKNCYIRWTHRSKAIQQWSSTSLSLTERIQNIVYGEKEGTDGVNVNSPNIKLDLPSDFVYYAWHRMVYLIPHPLQLPSANFTLAMLGIGNLVDALLNSSSGVPAIAHNGADGNTLLHMFGTYLFDAASKSNQVDLESRRGCAESLATLCKIFCKPQKRQPFLRTYIERFYASLAIGLKCDSCLPTILLSCTELFATDLEGVRMLVPDFISAIKMVLPKLKFDCKTNVSIDNLRLAAIKVLSTIMCLPNHFDKVELKLGWDSELNSSVAENVSLVGEQEQLTTQLIRILYASATENGNSERPFLSLKFYILEILLMSLRTETSSYNMRYILHLINVYVIEDVPFCPGLVGTVVKLIQEKILTMQLPADVTLVAFDVLMDFVNLYDFVKRDSKNVARELVLALSRYVDALINAGKLSQSYPLIVQAYDCMIKWILISQWIVDDRDCYKAVIATLSKGITIFDKETAPAVQAEPVSTEKKKRRDTAFPPTKQLFQLPPRVNKGPHHNTNNNQQQDNNSNSASSTANSSRNSSNSHTKEEMAVRMAAEYCMSQFVNHLGRFTQPSEHSLGGCRSAMVDDILQLKKFKQQQLQATSDTNSKTSHSCTSSPIRYFLIDKRTLLAIIEVTDKIPKQSPDQPDNVPSIVVVIRDTTGKYVWSMQSQYKDQSTAPIPVDSNNSPSDIIVGLTMNNYNFNSFLRPPTTDKPVTVPTAIAVNEKELPTLDKVFEPNTEEWKQWETIKILMNREEKAEKTHDVVVAQKMHDENRNYEMSPSRFFKNSKADSADGFRLLLAQMGLLLPKNRHHITPLSLNDTVITEMETLDMLNERDCISISAYFARSGTISWSELIDSPPPLSKQFIQFINCLGWPVDTRTHRGYKSKLNASICDTISYYSDRNVEFVVNVPYFLKSPSEDDMEWGSSNNNNTSTISKIYQQISSDDHVCVIWIEDLSQYTLLAKLIKTNSSSHSKTMVYIFINPLKNSANGLYWVRILVPSQGATQAGLLASQRLNDNALIFGPLVDGIVVSRHALGSMVRSTAISAHQACRVVTDTYTRPYVIRKEYIEEMAHRHRTKTPLSEFYTEIFSDKEN